MARKQTTSKITREEWLHEAADRLCTGPFKRAGLKCTTVQVSVGWPLGRRVVKKKGESGVIGQCFAKEAADDRKPHIFISPVLDDGVVIIATLAHELIHAIMPAAGHGPEFARAAEAVGLEGKPTATVPGEAFKRFAEEIIRELGPFPHGGLSAGESSHRPKEKGSRMIKCECPKDGYIVRTTRKWLDVGNPRCPFGHEMPPEDEDAGDKEGEE